MRTITLAIMISLTALTACAPQQVAERPGWCGPATGERDLSKARYAVTDASRVYIAQQCGKEPPSLPATTAMSPPKYIEVSTKPKT